MQTLPSQLTSYVSAGNMLSFDLSAGETLLKTRAALGASIGALLGTHFTPEMIVAGAFLGFSAGIICGVFEYWVWFN